MRKSSMTGSMAALLAMAALSGGPALQVHPSGKLALSETSTQKPSQDRGKQAPGDTKSDRLSSRGRWALGAKARGKRYRASVRQHQRHAAKARNRKA